MAVINMEMPEAMVTYVMSNDKESQLTRNAMILYPYIHDGVISHGKAADCLDLLEKLYG